LTAGRSKIWRWWSWASGDEENVSNSKFQIPSTRFQRVVLIGMNWNLLFGFWNLPYSKHQVPEGGFDRYGLEFVIWILEFTLSRVTISLHFPISSICRSTGTNFVS
jgi:hypothetical protein